MTRLDFSWSKDERYWHFENGKVVIHDDAPKEVKESYERYLKQAEAARKRGTLLFNKISTLHQTGCFFIPNG